MPHLQPDEAEYLARVDKLSKVINARIGQVEENPFVIIGTLMRLLAITTVTENFHRPWIEVRSGASRAFRAAMNEALSFFMTVQATEQTANDETPPNLTLPSVGPKAVD